jgi:hypothetical protein
VAAYRRGHPRRQVVLVARKVCPLTLAAQREPICREHLDFHVESQGQGQDVKAWTEIGR